MNTAELDSTEVVPNYTYDVDDMENPDTYTEEVTRNDDPNEMAEGDAIAGPDGDGRSNEPRLSNLPLSRIKTIMKLDPDFQLASAEAIFLVTKATELFIESLAKESFVHTAQAKKKTVQKRDIDMAIASVDALMFLEGTMNG